MFTAFFGSANLPGPGQQNTFESGRRCDFHHKNVDLLEDGNCDVIKDIAKINYTDLLFMDKLVLHRGIEFFLDALRLGSEVQPIFYAPGSSPKGSPCKCLDSM